MTGVPNETVAQLQTLVSNYLQRTGEAQIFFLQQVPILTYLVHDILPPGLAGTYIYHVGMMLPYINASTVP